MNSVVLHLGSNIGSKKSNIDLAILLISQEIGLINTQSSYYVTDAWGIEDQPSFINAAVIVDSLLEPEEILEKIHVIEQKLGRRKIEKWGPRIIDIDILFFNKQIIEKANLKIPHPEITNRNFVLVPLKELMPEFVHPVLHTTIEYLCEKCEDKGRIRKL